jgi:metal-sulfur cluster biosynthetic enzyme
MPTKEQVIELLKPIHDPEIRIGIVDLGLIYDVLIDEDTGKVIVKMTLTTPACPYGEMLISMVHRAVEEIDDVKGVEVKLVWDPPWDPKEMCSDGAKDILGIW